MKWILSLLLFINVAHAQVTGSSANFIPPGAVMAFALNNCPSGWLLADGSTPSRAAYPRLFNSMGSIHGNGNGTTTFHLPDYRGHFLRMVTGASAADPDAATRTAMAPGGNAGNAVGSIQDDMFESHVHGGNFIVSRTPYQYVLGGGGSTRLNSNTDATGGTETRPKNAYVLYCIKI